MTRGKAILVVVIIAAASGCVEGTSYVTNNMSDEVAVHILKQPPPQIKHRLDVSLEDKVVLLGYDLNRDTVEPGGRVKVTWYWQCKNAPGPGWKLFTHILDKDGKSQVNRDKVGQIRKLFQPEHWQPGMVIRDIQLIEVPGSWRSEIIELRVGLWKGKLRMRGKDSLIDGENRIKGPRVEVKSVKTISIKIPYTKTAPVIDGKFEKEEAWSNAAQLSEFSHTLSGKPARRKTEVQLMWDEEKLYVAMQADDDYLKSRYSKHDDELWHEDVFEVFLDPLGDKKNYYELQVSPAGVVFDSYLPSYRKNQNQWTSGMVAKVETQGKLNDDSDDDKGWTAELEIPFSPLSNGGGVPPVAGDKWRANFFRMDMTPKKKYYSSWSPPLRGDFHALDMFGEIVFEAPQATSGSSSYDRTKADAKSPKEDKKEK